jgi:hypothetical protein
VSPQNAELTSRHSPAAMSESPIPPDDDLEPRLRASRRLIDAPEALIQRAIDVFQATATVPQPGLLQRWLANLTFDTGLAPAAALGLRSGGVGARQLLFSSEGRDIDLRLVAESSAERGRAWRLSGQILGPDAKGTVLVRYQNTLRSTAWNDLAEFSLDGIPEGRIEVTLRSGEWEIDLPPIDIPAAGGADVR